MYFCAPADGEQTGSEEVFLWGDPPQQGSFKGQGGPDGGLHAQQHQGNFQGKGLLSKWLRCLLSLGFTSPHTNSLKVNI